MNFIKKANNIIHNLFVYKDLLLQKKLYAFFVVISNVIASFCEGMSLVVLIPLIQIATGDNSSEFSFIVTYIINFMKTLNLELTIPTIIAVFCFFAFFSAITNYISSFAMSKFRRNAEAELKRSLFDSLMESEWTYLARNKTGALTKSLLQDTNQASNGFLALLFCFSYIITFIVLLFLAFALSLQMTLLTLSFAFIIAPFYILILKKGQRSGQATNNFANDLSAEATEILINAKLMFSQGLREAAKSRFAFINKLWCKELLNQIHQNALIKLIFEVTAALFVSSFLFLVLWHQKQSIGLTLVFLMIFYRLAPRISQFQACFYQATVESCWLINLQQIIKTAKEYKQPKTGTIKPKFEKHIDFQEVSFSYHSSEKPILENISLNIPSKSVLAIIGGSGEGKSTILDLITGLIRPQQGIITIDDDDLNQIKIDDWQANIGMVLQENPIINATIAENIVFGFGELDTKKLERIAKLAGISDFIAEMQNGFNTIAGERGSRLSGGQRQRIALARALYREPKLLILDEITSALDSISTEKLINSLKEIKGQTTIILVTHDYRLLNMADQIINVFNGQIAIQPLNH